MDEVYTKIAEVFIDKLSRHERKINKRGSELTKAMEAGYFYDEGGSQNIQNVLTKSTTEKVNKDDIKSALKNLKEYNPKLYNQVLKTSYKKIIKSLNTSKQLKMSTFTQILKRNPLNNKSFLSKITSNVRRKFSIGR